MATITQWLSDLWVSLPEIFLVMFMFFMVANGVLIGVVHALEKLDKIKVAKGVGRIVHACQFPTRLIARVSEDFVRGSVRLHRALKNRNDEIFIAESCARILCALFAGFLSSLYGMFASISGGLLLYIFLRIIIAVVAKIVELRREKKNPAPPRLRVVP